MNDFNLKALPISNKEENGGTNWKNIVKRLWSPVISVLISIFGGFVVGLSTRSMKESYIYGTIFIVESFVCCIVGLILKNSRIKTIFFKFVLYFSIAGSMTVFSSWFGFKLS